MEPLYNTIGTMYGATRCADPAITQSLARFVDLHDGGRFLDLACGTGNYTCALAALGGDWNGIDVSDEMLSRASAKSSGIDWRLGSASRCAITGCIIISLRR
jgi:ubiquinone/menaquinone biosynthesis C-methylase UbiE